MTIHHHLSDDLLLSYAAGSLAEGWSLAVATHLALCPAAGNAWRWPKAVGGELLEAIDRRRRRRKRSPGDARTAHGCRGRAPVASRRQADSARSLATSRCATMLAAISTALRWRSLGRGAAQLRIRPRDRETQVRLLRIPAGKPVPEHGHGGRELTLVLTGAFHDGEAVFGPGDIEDADAEPDASADRPPRTPTASALRSPTRR